MALAFPCIALLAGCVIGVPGQPGGYGYQQYMPNAGGGAGGFDYAQYMQGEGGLNEGDAQFGRGYKGDAGGGADYQQYMQGGGNPGGGPGYQQYMQGGGDSGGGPGYQQYMQGGGGDYQQYMQGGGGQGGGTGGGPGYQQYMQGGGGDYQQYMQGGGGKGGGADYQQYMQGGGGDYQQYMQGGGGKGGGADYQQYVQGGGGKDESQRGGPGYEQYVQGGGGDYQQYMQGGGGKGGGADYQQYMQGYMHGGAMPTDDKAPAPKSEGFSKYMKTYVPPGDAGAYINQWTDSYSDTSSSYMGTYSGMYDGYVSKYSSMAGDNVSSPWSWQDHAASQRAAYDDAIGSSYDGANYSQFTGGAGANGVQAGAAGGSDDNFSQYMQGGVADANDSQPMGGGGDHSQYTQGGGAESKASQSAGRGGGYSQYMHGGGAGFDYSQYMVGGGDYSQYMQGGGAGFNYSQYMGEGGDYSQYMQGGGAGFNYSQYMGGGGDYSQYMQGGGAGVDYSQYMGGGGDYSQYMQGYGGSYGNYQQYMQRYAGGGAAGPRTPQERFARVKAEASGTLQQLRTLLGQVSRASAAAEEVELRKHMLASLPGEEQDAFARWRGQRQELKDLHQQFERNGATWSQEEARDAAQRAECLDGNLTSLEDQLANVSRSAERFVSGFARQRVRSVEAKAVGLARLAGYQAREMEGLARGPEDKRAAQSVNETARNLTGAVGAAAQRLARSVEAKARGSGEAARESLRRDQEHRRAVVRQMQAQPAQRQPTEDASSSALGAAARGTGDGAEGGLRSPAALRLRRLLIALAFSASVCLAFLCVRKGLRARRAAALEAGRDSTYLLLEAGLGSGRGA